MRIHGGVYVVLGILMALYSKFIQSKLNNSSMSLFFWIGIGFVAFGVFRLITLFVFKDSSSKVSVKKSKSNNSELERLKAEKEKMMKGNNQGSERSVNGDIVACPRCGTKHYSTSNFCHMCGCSLK